MRISAAEPAAPGRTASTPRAEDVLTASAGLFERQGYSATTMSQIGRAVGVLPGSLYHHFASKEDIAVRLLDRYDTALRAIAESQREPAAGVRSDEPLRDLISGVVAASSANGAAVRMRSHEAPSVATSELRDALQRQDASLQHAWRAAVAAAAPELAGTADSELFTFLVQRMACWAPLYLWGSDTTELAGHLSDILLHGVAVGAALPCDEAKALRAVREATADWGESIGPSDSRDVILRAARHVFARRGYDSTRMRDIGAAAGIPLGTVYRRFAGKEEILREIIGAFAARLDAGVSTALTVGDSATESLSAFAYVLVRARRCFPEESEILSVGWSGRDSAQGPLRDYFTETRARFDLLVETIGAGSAAGTLRPIAEPRQVAAIVRDLCWQPYPSTASSDTKLIRFVRTTLLQGLDGSIRASGQSG